MHFLDPSLRDYGSNSRSSPCSHTQVTSAPPSPPFLRQYKIFPRETTEGTIDTLLVERSALHCAAGSRGEELGAFRLGCCSQTRGHSIIKEVSGKLQFLECHNGLGLFPNTMPNIGERPCCGHTEFDFTVDEGKGIAKPFSRQKIRGARHKPGQVERTIRRIRREKLSKDSISDVIGRDALSSPKCTYNSRLTSVIAQH